MYYSVLLNTHRKPTVLNTETTGIAVQIIIALSGAIAILLTQSNTETVRQWACVIGLIGQPFWFYATIKARQWGMLALTCFYTAAWLKGLFSFWITM